MDTENIDPARRARYSWMAGVCGFAAAALGMAVLVGWALGIAALKYVQPGWVAMMPNTALGFLFAGASLMVASRGEGGSACFLAKCIPAALVMLLGLATLGEYFSGADFGIDRLLLTTQGDPGSTRMAMATAAGFVFTGLALILQDARQGPLASQAMALAAALIGGLAVLGYAYGVGSLYRIGAYAGVALHTGIGLVVINLGVLLSRPRRGLMAVVSSPTAGGVMLRRLLPLAVAAPFVIGWLRVQGEAGGFYGSEFGVALVALTYMALFTAILWRTAEALRDSELRRLTAESALRQREAQLTGIIDSAMDAIITVDAEQRVVLFNPAAEQMFGRSAADMRGLPIDVLLPQRFQAAHAGHVRAFGASDATHGPMGRQGPVTGMRANGEEFPVEASRSQVTVNLEKFYTVIMHDITERRKTELAMQAANAEAERANNAKSRFLAAASHDLRQPLSALGLYVDILRTHVEPAEQQLVANMKECIGSLSGLLSDLLDLSKLEAGVVSPNASDFPIADVLAGLVSIHAPHAQLKGLRLRCATSGATVRTDPVLLRRILGNLIDNAIRYTKRGGVLVGCRRRPGKVRVEVWDTGIGIPQEKTAEIFEEFRQLDNDAQNRGSGLGLAIVAKTAALLGLEVTVRSWPGRGSVFAVEVPVGEAMIAPKPVPAHGETGSLRIALVEDNASVREAFANALAGIGHRVVAAATADELRGRLGGQRPDIVVSDYRLGHGETGFDVIRAVRAAMGTDLPAILITGDTDPKLMRSMADRGIVVLHEPLELETLQAYLEDLTCQTGL